MIKQKKKKKLNQYYQILINVEGHFIKLNNRAEKFEIKNLCEERSKMITASANEGQS